MQEQEVIEKDPKGKVLHTYLKKDVIGHGGFAKCYLMINEQKQRFAGKVILRQDLRTKSACEKLQKEVSIHKYKSKYEDHQIIPILLASIQCSNFKVPFISFYNFVKMQVQKFLKSRIRLTQFEAKCYLKQIIEALDYLHTRSILHRDIKLGNIFINSKMQVKIGDFGLSTYLKDTKDRKYSTCGTPNYIPPEILSDQGHSFGADIWALGIILYALIVGRPPFESDSVEETYRRIKRNNFSFPVQIPISTNAKNLITQILQPNQQNRISLKGIVGHDFIKQYKIPTIMPTYTISIPPQSNFVKQFTNEKIVAKLTIQPKKINNPKAIRRMMSDSSFKGIQNNKISRVLSLDKRLLKTQVLKDKSLLDQVNFYKPQKKKSTQNKKLYSKTPTKINTNKSPMTLLKLNSYKEETNSSSIQGQDTSVVVCYYDMSEWYGIGYMLSNGNIGVIFNDKSCLSGLQQGGFMYNDTKEKLLYAIPSSLSKKAGILKICEQKLRKYLDCKVPVPYKSKTYVRRYLKFKEQLVLKLSNSIIQFFWGADSVTLRGYRWIKWQLGDEEGQSSISSKNLTPEVQAKVSYISQFLKLYSSKSVHKLNHNQSPLLTT